MSSQTPEAFADIVAARVAAIITERDQTIVSLRALLISKDDEIADLKRDCSRLQGRLAKQEQRTSLDLRRFPV